MTPTIYDIAKKCNCSTTTVSKVLNNFGKISPSKKAEILQAAKELGYVANKTAQSLASSNKSSKLIGIVLHTLESKSITHEMFSSILNSFRIEMEKNDYDICFLRNINSEDDITYQSLIKARGIDGVFVLACDQKNQKVKALFESDIPLVAFDAFEAKYFVTSNNREIVAHMVDYLIEQGHKRIAFVYPDKYGISKKRYEGFINGLKRNNLEFDERMIIDAPFYCTDSAKIAVEKVIESKYEPTVIMFPDDYTAIHAITYLRKYSMKVPNDISITGFDGIELANAIRPPLATIKQNCDDLGKAAAELLLEQINKVEITEPHRIVEASLIRGKSVSKIN